MPRLVLMTVVVSTARTILSLQKRNLTLHVRGIRYLVVVARYPVRTVLA